MRILDVGSSATPKLASGYSEIEIVCCDLNPGNYVEIQDMERLSYPDNSFDIVLCINALDHTINAETALKELIRVSKGFVYVNCALDQKTRHRKKHYWDCKEDGRFVNDTGSFDLKDYGFVVELDDGRMMATRRAE